MTARTVLVVGATTAALAAAAYGATRWGGRDGSQGGAGERRDVIITRDGPTHEGRLVSCVPESCLLDRRTFERRTIRFIGLQVESAVPPPVEDPSRDAVWLRVGQVVYEPLARIDTDRVFAGPRTFERREVTWIYLASSEPEGGSLSQTTERPPAPVAFKGCPADKPLGAWIWLRNDYQNGSPPSCRGTETQVVRFRLEPDPGTQAKGSPVALSYSARELRYSVSTDGCFSVPDRDPNTICNAEGTFVEGTLPLSDEKLGFAKFFPLFPQLSFQYPTPPTWPFQLKVQCLNRPTGTRTESTVTGFTGIYIDPNVCDDANHMCHWYCVAPTACHGVNYARSECIRTPERFAAIPFEGALVDGPVRGCGVPGASQVRWRVCCGCAESGPPPEFTSPRGRGRGGPTP